MGNYTSRAAELLEGIERAERLPEAAAAAMRQAVSDYMPQRAACLTALCALLSDERADHAENVRSWKEQCDRMRSTSQSIFDKVSRNLVLETDAAVAVYGWQMQAMQNEDGFFAALAETEAAPARDELVAHARSLRDYTEVLEQKWKRIVDDEKELHSEQAVVHQDMVRLVRDVISELAERDRTLMERAAQFANVVTRVATEGNTLLLLRVKPDVENLIEWGAEALKAATGRWLEANRYLDARWANLAALVQAEKGGVLPLFRETRREVALYKDRRNLDKAKSCFERGADSLEGWRSDRATPAQQGDAEAFREAAVAALEARLAAVREVVEQFEKRWSGVFDGALSSSVADELLDTPAWMINARTLVEIGTPTLVRDALARMDGYLQVSFEEPLAALQGAALALPEAQRQDALSAVEGVHDQVKASIRDRILELRKTVGESLSWFEPAAIEASFDRSALRKEIE